MATRLGNNVHTDQQQQQQGQPQPQQGQQQQQGQPQQPNQPPKQRKSLNSLSSNIQRQIKRSQMDQLLSNFKKEVDEIFKDVLTRGGVDIKYHLIPVDGQSHNLYYSAAILVGEINLGKKIVAGHTMILEGSAAAPSPVHQNYWGTQIEVKYTPMCAWETEMAKTVDGIIADHFPGAKVINAYATVIPTEVEPDDKDRVWQILWAAHEAINGHLESNDDQGHFVHFDLSQHYDPYQDDLTATFTFNGETNETTTGLPLRNDIQMELLQSEKRKRFQNQTGFQQATANRLGEASGFVDLVFNPPEQPMMAQWQGQQINPQVFIPRIVITRILSEPFTPELFFLVLATFRLISDNYSWLGQFSNYERENVHDIGAIGYRVKQVFEPNSTPERIDTKSGKFDQETLEHTAYKFIRPTPVISIDVETAGPESWLTNLLRQAAIDPVRYVPIISKICDNLTGGRFSKCFEANVNAQARERKITFSENNLVHLGTYHDGNMQRDLRDFDSLAVLSLLGGKDLSAVNEWDDTFNNHQLPRQMRLDKRYKMLSKLANNIRLKGYAERINFTGVFIDSLADAVVGAELEVSGDGLYRFFGHNYQMGNPNLDQGMIQGNIAGRMMPSNNQGAVPQQNQTPFNW